MVMALSLPTKWNDQMQNPKKYQIKMLKSSAICKAQIYFQQIKNKKYNLEFGNL